MPITKRKGKWYWGDKGPYNSRNKAEEVQRAAFASGYGVQQKIEKIETGAPMDGHKRQLTVTEVAQRTKKLNPEIIKEDGGSSGDGLSGTVFTSTDAGIFNPTFGEKKKNKKKSGIERLNDFVTDNSPLKLNVEKQEWASTGGQFGHHGPVRIDWEKRKLDEEDVQQMQEYEGHPDKDAATFQDDKTRHIEDIDNDGKPKALKKDYGFGPMGGQGDPLHRANTKDILSRNPRDDEGEEEEESNIPEEMDLKDGLRYGKMMYKSAGWDKIFKSLIDEL
jgi:hypothetical protein|tara:strand:+ start:257 stop:1087 length:831 start_codon:yes stop_codon:yes gene_type:complete